MVVAYASALAEAGHHVTITANQIDTVFELNPLVIVKTLRFPGKTGTIRSVLTEQFDADVIIADIIAMAFLLSLGNRKRVVYFAQDYNENSYDMFFQKLFIRLLYTASFAWLKVPVIAVSAELAKIFTDRFGVIPNVVCNGVDLKTFYFDPSEDLLREKGERKVVLFFSRRDSRKGFDLALAVVANLFNTHFPSLLVWTVGEPLLDGDVPCQRQDFGYVGESRLRQIMSSADVFLYPSRNEGFGLMVLEAFACKCPVVTTDAISYTIDGENALVARIEDVDGLTAKVGQILTDRKLASELADNAGILVLDYALESSAKEFEANMKALLEK